MDGSPAAKAKLEEREARVARARVLLYWTMALFVLIPWVIFLLRSIRRR
jgi:hypothetical protein